MELIKIENIKELEPYWVEIDDLIQKVHPNIFLMREWLSSWWEVFGKNRTLQVYLFLDGHGKVAGFAPLSISKEKMLRILPVRQLLFWGSGAVVKPEHLTFCVYPEFEEEFWKQIWERLLSESGYDVVHLMPVDRGSELSRQLDRLGTSGIKVTGHEITVCPFLNLPDNYEDYLASRSYNTRQTMRKIRRRLQRKYEHVEFEIIEDPEKIEESLQLARKLHEKSRSIKNQTGNFAMPGYLEFHQKFARRLLENQHLLLAFLKLDGEPVAFRYGFVANGRYYDYQTGYDTDFQKERVGMAVVDYVIEYLISKGVKHFDFLRGGYSYKYHWAESETVIMEYNIFKNTPYGIMLYLLMKMYLKFRKTPELKQSEKNKKS
ncbi:MAG: GNAT family N-acetyltransferase [Calditrichia bacterium]